MKITKQTMKLTRKITILFSAAVAMAASSAQGAFTFTNGDLILGFQATAGQGSTTNVFFNLGSGVYHRNNPGYNFGVATNGNNPFGTSGQTQIGNVNATLTLAFGSNWYDRSDVSFGIIGNLNSNPTSGIGSKAAVSGDPSRTMYVSQATETIGGSVLWTGYSTSALGIAGGSVTGLEGILPGLTTQADGAAILSQATQAVEWNNSWTAYNTTAGAFNTFSGGIQQNFGEGLSDTQTLIDLQRIVATNTGASPAGTPGTGVYETTFSISRSGNIAAIPEASTSILAATAVSLLAFRRRRTQLA